MVVRRGAWRLGCWVGASAGFLCHGKWKLGKVGLLANCDSPTPFRRPCQPHTHVLRRVWPNPLHQQQPTPTRQLLSAYLLSCLSPPHASPQPHCVELADSFRNSTVLLHQRGGYRGGKHGEGGREESTGAWGLGIGTRRVFVRAAAPARWGRPRGPTYGIGHVERDEGKQGRGRGLERDTRMWNTRGAGDGAEDAGEGF